MKDELIQEWNKLLTKETNLSGKEKILENAGLKYETLENPPIFWVWNNAGERYQYFYLLDKWASWPESKDYPPTKYYQASTMEWFLEKINNSFNCQIMNENEKIK